MSSLFWWNCKVGPPRPRPITKVTIPVSSSEMVTHGGRQAKPSSNKGGPDIKTWRPRCQTKEGLLFKLLVNSWQPVQWNGAHNPFCAYSTLCWYSEPVLSMCAFFKLFFLQLIVVRILLRLKLTGFWASENKRYFKDDKLTQICQRRV